MSTSIYYHFRQHFRVTAQKAFEWCTTYTPEDQALMGEKKARREIEKITDQTLILTDTLNIGSGNQIEKQKLVQIYPDLLFWTSTHLNGPVKHSQFLYKITADSVHDSYLDFTGQLLDYGDEKLSTADTDKLAENACKTDAATWVLLAKAMEEELI